MSWVNPSVRFRKLTEATGSSENGTELSKVMVIETGRASALCNGASKAGHAPREVRDLRGRHLLAKYHLASTLSPSSSAQFKVAKLVQSSCAAACWGSCVSGGSVETEGVGTGLTAVDCTASVGVVLPPQPARMSPVTRADRATRIGIPLTEDERIACTVAALGAPAL